MSIESDIFTALKATLETLPWVKTVEFENIKVIPTDFQEHEIPAIQFFDNRAAVTHQRGLILPQWSLSVELILKSTVSGTVDQLELLDKKNDIENTIGANVSLNDQGVNGFLHFRYDGWETDLHSMQPFYAARLDFTALYQKNFSGC